MGLRILPVFGRNKEKETVALFRKHANIIGKMSKPLQEAVDAAFKKKDFKLVLKKADEIDKLEKEADATRKDTATLLYGYASSQSFTNHKLKARILEA